MLADGFVAYETGYSVIQAAADKNSNFLVKFSCQDAEKVARLNALFWSGCKIETMRVVHQLLPLWG